MTLTYVLHEAGWAAATISHDGRRLEMIASYLSDPVAEMAEAAICLLQGSDAVKFSFLDEPGEHRCHVTRVGASDAQIRVLWFDDGMPALPDEPAQRFSCAAVPSLDSAVRCYHACSISRKSTGLRVTRSDGLVAIFRQKDMSIYEH